VFLTAFAIAGCATNPATGERQLSLVGEGQEVEMGRTYAQEVDQTMPAYDDSGLRAYVDRVGQSLATTSERPELPWTFKVLDDPVVNAFAIPGGFIYVTRGILTHFNSEGELASVLGHEIGHVTARHSVEQMSRAQLGGLLLGVGAIVSEDVRRFGGLAQAGLGVLFLTYGRDAERQADSLGVRYAVRDNYDPREAIHVHQTLGRLTQERGGNGVPSWLSSHPSSADRIDRIQAELETLPADALDGRIEADAYLRQIGGVTFGPNPRHGYFIESRFVHPDLAFEFSFLDGWQTANLPQAVVGQSANQDAIFELTLEPDGYAAAADAFFRQQGMRAGDVRRTTVNGQSAVTGVFQVETEQGVLEGTATFVGYHGKTYRLLGYTPAGRRSTYDGAFQRITRSFTRLTDAAILAVEPPRIDMVRVQRSATLRTMASSRPLPIPVPELAILNGVREDEPVAPGATIKWVVGETPPGTR
jgi:predicted Zn-dependent protease